MNIFDHLNNLTFGKKMPDFTNEEVSKTYDQFMINKFLSMFQAWVPIIEIANKYKFPNNIHFILVSSLLPKANVSFNNYIKKKKSNDVFDEQKELLMKYFEFGTNDLEAALDILTEEQIKNICDKYKFGKTR